MSVHEDAGTGQSRSALPTVFQLAQLAAMSSPGRRSEFMLWEALRLCRSAANVLAVSQERDAQIAAVMNLENLLGLNE